MEGQFQRRRRVLVTGTGVIACRENGVDALWKAVQRDRRLPEEGLALPDLLAHARVEPGDTRILGRHQLLAMVVVEEAWRCAGLDSGRNRIRGEASKIHRPRFGCVGGSSMGGVAALVTELETRLSPYSLSRWRANSVGAAVSVRFGLGGGDYALNAASATGSQVLQLAGTLVRAGLMDAVVVVASDPAMPDHLRDAMVRNGSVSEASVAGPLMMGRDGMRPVEGAACMILESEEHAAARGAVALAEWVHGEQASEGYHLLAPEPTGAVLQSLIRNTLQACAVRSVDWVSLHATGTARFDSVEVGALRAVFGDPLPWISAFKRTTGHALGATGLMDAVLVVEGLRHGSLPPWPDPTDPTLGLQQPPPCPDQPRLALQVGQGMGGVVVVNLLGRI